MAKQLTNLDLVNKLDGCVFPLASFRFFPIIPVLEKERHC